MLSNCHTFPFKNISEIKMIKQLNVCFRVVQHHLTPTLSDWNRKSEGLFNRYIQIDFIFFRGQSRNFDTFFGNPVTMGAWQYPMPTVGELRLTKVKISEVWKPLAKIVIACEFLPVLLRQLNFKTPEIHDENLDKNGFKRVQKGSTRIQTGSL